MDQKRFAFVSALVLIIVFSLYLSDEANAVVENVTQSEIAEGDASTMVIGAAGSISVQGGNLTEVNISAERQSGWWQGIWGSIHLNLTLEDASGRAFYNWGESNVIGGEVYISNDSVEFDSGISAASDLNVSYSQLIYGWANSTNIDNLTETYKVSNGHPFFAISLTPIFANSAATVNLEGGLFNCTMLWKDATIQHPLFAALINPDAPAYNGRNADFEALLPVRSHGAVEAYYFYSELT